MLTPEFIILLINAIIVGLGYLLIYPKVAGSDINKILVNDVIATCCALIIAGSVYWGSDITFNAIITTLDWFWFSLISYAAIEIPMMLWYFNKHNVQWR